MNLQETSDDITSPRITPPILTSNKILNTQPIETAEI